MKERKVDRRLIFLVVAFIGIVVTIKYAGIYALMVIFVATILYYLYKILFLEQEHKMLVGEIADKIAKDQEFYGVKMDRGRENVSGQEIPNLNLLLVWFKHEGKVFFYNLKTRNIIGPKLCTLNEAIDELYEKRILFMPPEVVEKEKRVEMAPERVVEG